MSARELWLPWPPKECNPNARVHWAIKRRAVKDARHEAYMLALAAGLPQHCAACDASHQHLCGDGRIERAHGAIGQALELGDQGTRAILEAILRDEEDHVDWLETQLDQIAQMGIQNYLVEKVG